MKQSDMDISYKRSSAMKKTFIVLILILLLTSCSTSSSKEDYAISEHYNCYSEEDISDLQNEIDELYKGIEYLESENTRLENELWETAGEYDERIFELTKESADYEEQAIEAEEKVEYYENLVKQYNLPTYEEANE